MKAIEPIGLVDSGEVASADPQAIIEVGLVPLEANAAPKPMQGFKAYHFTLWDRLPGHASLAHWSAAGIRIGPVCLSQMAFKRSYRKRAKKLRTEALIPAHVTALALLHQLEQEKPWNDGRRKGSPSHALRGSACAPARKLWMSRHLSGRPMNWPKHCGVRPIKGMACR